jgi:hypothetical protein
MKSKKAIKRLTRVEKLLAEVQSHYSALEKPLGKLLSSAKASVEGIKDSIAKSIKAKPAESKAAKSKKHGKKKAAKAQSDSKATPAVAQKRPAKRSGSRTRKSGSTKRPTVSASDDGMAAVTIAS